MTIHPFQCLIVEDDVDIAKLVTLQIESLTGKAQHVTSIKLAQEYLSHHDIDCIVLDLSLPDGDGLDFCRQLRQQEDNTPILMLTARSNEIDRVLGLELGADDYLSKPFSLAELKARIKALLRRYQKHNQPLNITADHIEVGCLKMKPKNHQAWLNQQPLSLTEKEYELLLWFAQHPDQVFSRMDLLENVWGLEHEGYEHTINAHLNRLRKKVELDPANPSRLETVWGVGYKLNTEALQQ